MRSNYDFQPIRETFMALAITLLLAGWWLYFRRTAIAEPILYLESALIFVIAAEAYARD